MNRQHPVLKGVLELLAVIGIALGLTTLLEKLGLVKTPPSAPHPSVATQASPETHVPVPSATPPVPLRSGWNRPLPATLPAPTYWPMIVSAGVVFLAWGVLTSWFIAASGGLLFVVGVVGWIGELRHDP